MIINSNFQLSKIEPAPEDDEPSLREVEVYFIGIFEKPHLFIFEEVEESLAEPHIFSKDFRKNSRFHLKHTVNSLVKENNLRDALQLLSSLLENSDKKGSNEAVVLFRELGDIEHGARINTFSKEEVLLLRNSLASRILDLCDSIGS